MIPFKGKYTTANVMIDEIDPVTTSQIVEMVNHQAFNQPIAIMPDCHAGKGSVIGFTMHMGSKVIPNTIGVDIGCGMLAVRLDLHEVSHLDLKVLDQRIREAVPFGYEVRKENYYNMGKSFPWSKANKQNTSFIKQFNQLFISNPEDLMKPTDYNYSWFVEKCMDVGADINRAVNSLGTLGSGNHFIEIGIAKGSGRYWLTVHSGSRQFGKLICQHWQNKPAERKRAESGRLFKEGVIKIKTTCKGVEIGRGIKKLRTELGLNNKVAKVFDYIEGKDLQGYLTDMIFTQVYASENRRIIAAEIAKILGVDVSTPIESVHNYIDFNDFIIRKGAISAHEGELMVIPFNMEDGILVCIGKGNKEWNYSAPHGAGRVKSRSKAKKELVADVAVERMAKNGIFTSAVPVDEMKEAYKDPELIRKAIAPTAKELDQLIPIMNIKGE